MTIAIHRDPFSIAPNVYHLPDGASLADIVGRIRTLPVGWPRHEHDLITINGHIAPKALWGAIRPKPGVEIGFHAPPMDGGGEGGGGGKQIITLIASIGLMALSGGIASGALLGGFTGAAAAGQATLLSRVVAAGVMVGGSLALAALSPTPTITSQRDDGDGIKKPGSASAQGNKLEPNAPLPRVIGTRKIFPPFLAEPMTYYDGQDEVVECVVGMAGPHKLEDIRIAGAVADSMGGVKIELRPGWPGYEPLDLLTRYSRTNATQAELRGHVMKEGEEDKLDDASGDIKSTLPQPKVLGTRNGNDEFWIEINLPQGLFRDVDKTQILRIPFRLRLRKKGAATWINAPEIHYAASRMGEKRASIRLVWSDGDSNATANSGRGWVEGRVQSPQQTLTPASGGWTADGYFRKVSGDDYVDGTNAGSTRVKNLSMGDDIAEINLDRAVFPSGIYEVEIVRGYAFIDANYTASTYLLSSAVRDFFGYEEIGGTPGIFQSKKSMSDKVIVVRAISIWNDAPIQKGGLALIAIQARNVSVNQLSVLASGYVKDWDGTGWNDWITTSNPAPHMRDVLGGTLNALPVPEDIIDDAGLVAWRSHCIAMGYTVDAICEDLSIAEVSNLVAGSGYAKPYQSEIWGVSHDRDRSADDPVQMFSPHNMSNFKWSKGYAKRPDGFRIGFADAEQDYENRQIIHPPGAGLTEQVTYDSLVNEADARARADYDLLTTKLRTTFYDFDAPAEAIKCRRGSLIYVQHDMLTEHTASGRVVDVEYDGAGDIAALVMDNEPPAISGPDWSDITAMNEVLDMSLIGTDAGVLIRRSGGSITAQRYTGTGARLVLSPAAPAGSVDVDDMVVVGRMESEARRMIVFSMQPREELVWTITAVDEAQEIWNV